MNEENADGGQDASGGTPHIPAELVDEALLQDIELLMQVIAELPARRCPLTARQVDVLLGVEVEFDDAVDG